MSSSTKELRQKFFNYFKKQGHTQVTSSATIPHNDPTLLFTNAGMNQFKDFFLGKAKPIYTRATTSQKCIRAGGKHNDLENVGHTARHLTFFEMLGNFSFGDYFKKEAIQFAYEVSTEVFGFDKEKLWVTVYKDDDEAFAMWQEYIDAGKLLKGRILRMDEDNFWAMGETGPCGPCTELYYDKGPKYGDAASPDKDVQGDRYIEFWNLVFMQFEKDGSGKMTPLPKPSIDTGAGLERVLSLMAGVDSVFETDVLRGLIGAVEKLSGISYETAQPEQKAAFRVIADHIRSLSFACTDGAIPSNVDRGYVLRKILRRAFRHGKTYLGLNEPFLAKIYPTLVELMGDEFTELKESQRHVCELLTAEEMSFMKTLDRGGSLLAEIIERSSGMISGADAFMLKDTYGFPFDETLLIAKDYGLKVDEKTFAKLEEEARQRSKSAHTSHKQLVEETVFAQLAKKLGPTEFHGYEEFEDHTQVVALFDKEGKQVSKIAAGEQAQICLQRTPFYAEKGGQVADHGVLIKDEGPESLFSVKGCIESHGIYLHQGKLEYGSISQGDTLFVQIDRERRRKIENNHTATHLLHYALCAVAGDHIKQEGSLVEPERLRFDFSHHKALSQEELHTIEKMVNEKIRQNISVSWHEIPLEAAQSEPNIKQFFGDKYGNMVRLVSIDDSKELCGGTHTIQTGTIGLFRIAKESSISAGVRRIEAFTGASAEEFMYQTEALVQDAAALLKTTAAELPKKVAQQLDLSRELKAEIKSLMAIKLESDATAFSKKIEQIGTIQLIVQEVDLDSEQIGQLAELLFRKVTKNLALVFATKGSASACTLYIHLSQDLPARGISAKDLIAQIAPKISGRGGGKATAAQAGGTDSSKIEEAFNAARTWLKGKA